MSKEEAEKLATLILSNLVDYPMFRKARHLKEDLEYLTNSLMAVTVDGEER